MGLFPFITRNKRNIRLFSEEDLEGVKIILCLREINMPISQIKHYIDLCEKGDSTLKERLAIIQKQKENTNQQIENLQKQIQYLNFKENYYLQLIEEGGIDQCNPLIHQ